MTPEKTSEDKKLMILCFKEKKIQWQLRSNEENLHKSRNAIDIWDDYSGKLACTLFCRVSEADWSQSGLLAYLWVKITKSSKLFTKCWSHTCGLEERTKSTSILKCISAFQFLDMLNYKPKYGICWA